MIVPQSDAKVSRLIAVSCSPAPLNVEEWQGADLVKWLLSTFIVNTQTQSTRAYAIPRATIRFEGCLVNPDEEM